MSASPKYTKKTLLWQIAEGDQHAFQDLYGEYKDDVYAFALGVTRSVPVAEEIVQESFTKVWLNRKKLPGIEKFEGWLFTVTRNLCYTAMRKIAVETKARISHQLTITDQPASVEEMAIAKENHQLLRQAIMQLPEQQRRVFLLRREQGLSYDEIAQELKISRNTVKEHLKRAGAAVRAYLAVRLGADIAVPLMFTIAFLD